MKKKTIIFIISIIVIIVGIIYFNNSTNKGQNETIKTFFSLYEKQQYEDMYEYLSPNMKETFKNTVNAIPKAKLKNIMSDNEKELIDDQYIDVNLYVEPKEESSIYPDTEWAIYLKLEKTNNKWIIVDFTTG